MTVEELIKLLEKQDQKKQVLASNPAHLVNLSSHEFTNDIGHVKGIHEYDDVVLITT